MTAHYSRIAVRPFPHTVTITRVITAVTQEVRRIIERKQAGESTGADLSLWEGSIPGPSGEIQLRVDARIGPFVTGTQGRADVDEEKNTAVIQLEILISPFFGGYGKYLHSRSFWSDLSQIVHHEMIHILDPKVWVKSIREKMPPYVDPHATGRWEEYSRHPWEVSAYGAEMYYYFQGLKAEGVPLKEAIHRYLTGNHRSTTYREVMKRGDRGEWQDYLTRVYKSAEQAYRGLPPE